MAAQLTEVEDRARMLEIAENYERLAVRAQIRADADAKGPGTTGEIVKAPSSAGARSGRPPGQGLSDRSLACGC